MLGRRSASLTLALLTVAVGTAFVASADQDKQNPQTAAQAGFDESLYPVAEYDAPEPDDPRRRELRRARGRSNVVAAAAEKLRIKEGDPAVVFDLPASHAPTEPALPVSLSDAVAVGEVTDAKAYLTDDKVSVYSEFTIRIQEVLKAGGAPLAPGSAVEAKRAGGRVRLPSGKVLLRAGQYGRNMPRVGGRYLFFLRFSEPEQVFTIVTGYGLHEGGVRPLDGDHKRFGETRQFAAYRAFENTDETTLLRKVRAEIASPSAAAPEKRGWNLRGVKPRAPD